MSRVIKHITFCGIMTIVFIFSSNNLVANYKYSIYPDSVMMKIEAEHSSLADQVDAIEEYLDNLFHLITLDFKEEFILPFFDKYSAKVYSLGKQKNIGYFNLYKGAYFLDALHIDSASTYFVKALNAFENIKDFTGITHASIFIAVNNNYNINIRNKSTQLIDFYYNKGIEASFIADDYFAKASGAWNKALQFTDINRDSLNYYSYLSFSYLLKLPDSRISKKLFGFMFLSYINDKYMLESKTAKLIMEKLIETYGIVMNKRIFNTMNYKVDKVSYYKYINKMDSAAYFARQLLYNPKSQEVWRKISFYKLSDYYLTIYNYEKSIGNFQEALLYYEKYHSAWIEIINQDPRITSVDNDRKIIQEQLDLEKKIQSQNQTIIIFIAGILITSVFLVSLYFYKRYKDKQRVNSELEKLNCSKDKLFSIVSHDLRSPVASLKQMLDVITIRYDKLDDEAKHKYINNLRVSSNKIYLMLDNLLSWSRLNLGNIKCKRVEVDVNSIISNELEMLEEQITGKSIALQITELENGICLIDENIFRIIFRNLITNAIKFSPISGKIEVNLVKELTKLTLIINDTGSGIDEATIEQIKNRSIVESMRGSANERGNGLGLTIVSELAEIHRGFMKIETNKFGKGTEVTVSFEC